MRRLPLLTASALVAPLLVATAAPPPAHADPKPGIADRWPRCGTLPDDDGDYCVVSVKVDGQAVPERVGSQVYETVEVDLIGDGDVRFAVVHYDDGSPVPEYDVAAGSTWEVTVDTGSIHPREAYGDAKDVSFGVTGSDAAGYRFTLKLDTTDVAGIEDATGCTFDDCGDDTTAADYDFAGWANGVVTDDQGVLVFPLAERQRRTGLVSFGNADQSRATYDYASNSILVELANPHLRADGTTPFVGHYETFIPDDVLRVDMGVPDPSSLTAGKVQVTRSSTPVAFVLTHERGGVRIAIDGITFSSPRYTIRPRPTKPGKPTVTKVSHPSRTSAKVAFTKPVADGGSKVTGYQARCRKAGQAWLLKRGQAPAIVVRALPKGAVSCQVRATNELGDGPWSASKVG